MIWLNAADFAVTLLWYGTSQLNKNSTFLVFNSSYIMVFFVSMFANSFFQAMDLLCESGVWI